MAWYQVENGQQRGPFSDAELAGRVAAGVAGPETLVWRDGMASWTPLRVAAPELVGAGGAAPSALEAAPSSAGVFATCGECGRPFPQGEMVPLGRGWACATCKPVVLQKLREGILPSLVLSYAGFGIRLLAKLVDGVILWVVTFVIALVFGMAAAGVASNPNMAIGTIALQLLLNLTVNALYVILFVARFGATPGKMACRLRIVNPDGSKVSAGKATGRFFAEWLSSLTLLIGYLIAAFDPERRALHDRICETRVVKV